MSESNNLDKQIKETKKETEQFKSQLRNLIDLRNANNNGKENAGEPTRVQNQKTNAKYGKLAIEKIKNCSHNLNVCSPKKVRNYDVQEARAYIKKQHEKRAQQQKSNEAKLKDEIKKEKLQKLHEKAQELVLKNVHSNRQRSRSREKEDYIRIDSCDQLRNKSVTKEKNILEYHGSKQPLQQNIRSKDTVGNLRGVKQKPLLKSPSSVPMPTANNLQCKEEYRLLPEVEARCVKNIEFHDVEIENNLARSCHNGSPLSRKDPVEKINILSNITIRPASISNSLKDNEISKQLNLNEVQIEKLECLQANKPTQNKEISDIKKEYPLWLQEGPQIGHPLNFINTVKRKLQYAALSPNQVVDIGIQSSLAENNEFKCANFSGGGNPVAYSEQNDISRNKSFLSHKHQNLDIESVRQMEFIPKGREESKDGSEFQKGLKHSHTSRKVAKTKEESESDTSKNIPDISSESGTSLRKNAESVRRNLSAEFNLSIDTDRMNQMRLMPQIKSGMSTIRSENPNTFTHIPINNSNRTKSSRTNTILNHSTENIYDYDFESDNISGSPCLSKSRDSILSFNSPEYNDQKIAIPFSDMNKHVSTKNVISHSPTYLNNQILVQSQNDKSPLATELSIPSVKSHSSVHSSSIISSSRKNRTHSSHKVQKEVPEIIITEHAESTEGSIDTTLSSLNDNILSSSHKETNNHSSSQRELSYINLSQKNINTRRGSGKSHDKFFNEILPLDEPKVYLSNNTDINETYVGDNEEKSKLLKNVSVRSRNLNCNQTEKTNEIHLKFEAEIHLLKDFNESLKQFSAVEKVVESLKCRKESSPPNILKNKDTQTSGTIKSSISTKSTTRSGENEKKELPTSTENKDTQTPRASHSSSSTKSTTRVGEKENKNAKSRSELSSINFSRGSLVDNTSFDKNIFENSVFKLQDESRKNSLSTLNDTSVNLNKSIFGTGIQSMPIGEISSFGNYAGFSLIMFDQLIKDEDARLEHLKMILKIREKALLDRVRAELASLEIQRKHYKETGNLQEVSAIKKKQRGILLNHQREKYEMQRVKQIQQAASVERKTILKEKRKLIRKQLSTDNMLGKMKVNTPRKRTSSGPLKVIQSHTESIMSETSVSRKSSTEREEVYSITSHHTVSRFSEISEVDITIPKNVPTDMETLKRQQNIKRTLLMREAALRKRRKEAEELLQWNQKLLDEEKRISELELKASSIIRQQHNTTIAEEKYIFNGKQLNKLWYNLTGCAENKFSDKKIYRMSQIALERFCKSAREYSVKSKKLVSKSSNSDYSAADISVSEIVPKTKTVHSSNVPTESEQHKDVSVKDYTSDFEVDTSDNIVDVEDIEVNENINELDELIHNFSRIEDDISSLSSKHSRVSLPREEIRSESLKSNKSESEAEISVIETNGIPKDISSLNQRKVLIEFEPLIHTEHKTSYKTDVSVKTDYSNTSSKKRENLSLSADTQDNLNKSKEILLILGESETNISQKSTGKDQKPDEQTSFENINTSEEILSTLNQIVDSVSTDNIHEDTALINFSIDSVPEREVPVKSVLTESEDNLNVSKKILNVVPAKVEDVLLGQHSTLVNSFGELSVNEISVSEASKSDQNERIEQPQIMHLSNNFTVNANKELHLTHHENDLITEEGFNETDIEEEISVDPEIVKKSDEFIEAVHGTVVPNVELDVQPSVCTQSQDTNSRSKFLKAEHSEQLVGTGDFENDVTTDKSYATSDDLEYPGLSSGDSSAALQNLQTGSLDDDSSSRFKETVAQQISINPPCTIENETEHIQEQSEISKKDSSAIQTDSNEVQNECYSPDRSHSDSTNEIPSISNTSQSNIVNDSKSLEKKSVPNDVNDRSPMNKMSPKNENIDVKKRISDIMTPARGVDNSPRLQDLYTTTYDLMSPTVSPDSESPAGEQLKIAALSGIFGNEAEEILKKQLAIEQEIKLITEQQQKQQMPYMYMREIPNKPPPPYTPPSSSSSTTTSAVVIPTVEEIDEITKYSAKILHKAYLSNNLENILISGKTLSLIAKDIPKEKYKFVFDLCKDLSKAHYKQFIIENCPTWLQVCKKPQLIVNKPFGVNELEKYMSKKLREVFGYEKPHRKENSIIKWSRKKRDHIDEILVVENQAEEDQWVNYEKDELLVMNQITNDIMGSLLTETADIFSEILWKRQQ